MQVFLTLDDQVGCTAADRQFYLGIRMHVYLRVCREGKILIAPETHPNVIFFGHFFLLPTCLAVQISRAGQVCSDGPAIAQQQCPEPLWVIGIRVWRLIHKRGLNGEVVIRLASSARQNCPDLPRTS